MQNFGQKIDGIEGLYEVVGKLTSYEERSISVAGVEQERYKAIVPDDGSEIATSIVSKDYVLIQHEKRKANIANTFHQGKKALQLLHPIALTIKPKA